MAPETVAETAAAAKTARPWRPAPLFQASLALHAAGLALVAAAPSRWRLVVGALVLNHAVICAAGTVPRSRLLGPNLSRLPTDGGAERDVFLTFDDGPDPEVTPAVLELLAHHDATATFFLIGRRAEAFPELVSAIVDGGHLVENHTWRHPNTFAFFGPRRLAREIDRAQATLTGLAGRPPAYFRAPAGIRNPWLDPLLARRDLVLTSWSHRGFDTVVRDPDRILRRLLRGLGPGDVALLHDGSAARDRRGRPVVLEVLPRLLAACEQRGLRPCALPPTPPPIPGRG